MEVTNNRSERATSRDKSSDLTEVKPEFHPQHQRVCRRWTRETDRQAGMVAKIR